MKDKYANILRSVFHLFDGDSVHYVRVCVTFSYKS